MKTRTLKLALYSLLMTAMLFNCKDKDKSDPTDPDPGSLTDIGNVTLPVVAITAPDEVQTTPGSVEASAATTAVTGDLANIAASGVVPASVTNATGAVSGALSADDINTLSSLSLESILASSASGSIPANIQAIMDKAMANPALAAYLPKLTLPTVNGKRIGGTLRVGSTDAVESVEKVSVDDACVAKAQAAYDAAKVKLDAAKASKDSEIATAYTGWVAKIPTDQTTCTAAASTTATASRTAAQNDYSSSVAALESARSVLGESNYALLSGLYKVVLSITLSSLTTLEAADKNTCIAIAAQATINATAKRDDLLNQNNAGYTTSIAEAKRLQGVAAATCHNQGSGQ